ALWAGTGPASKAIGADAPAHRSYILGIIPRAQRGLARRAVEGGGKIPRFPFREAPVIRCNAEVFSRLRGRVGYPIYPPTIAALIHSDANPSAQCCLRTRAVMSGPLHISIWGRNEIDSFSLRPILTELDFIIDRVLSGEAEERFSEREDGPDRL